MYNQNEKLQAYIRIKWSIALLATPLLFFWLTFGGISLLQALPIIAFIILSVAFNLFFIFYKLKQDHVFPLMACSFGLDLFLIMIFIYFGGGIENNWIFILAIYIFISGIIFKTSAGFIYATLAFGTLLLMHSLEYSGLIPHSNPYITIPSSTIWRSPEYFLDKLSSFFLLFYLSAFAGSFLNQQLEKSLFKTDQSRLESEKARQALMNISSDLESAKKSLEIRVKERTAELEEAKASLESKVRERTGELENSRKAILHMMKDLKEDIKKLREVDSMKTEFLSMISHELRTPLTLIKGYVALLQAGKIGPLSPEQNKTIEIVARQSDHLHSMIDSILDISRLEIGKPIPLNRAPMSFKSAVEKTIEALKIQAKEKKIEITSNISDFLPTIVGDEIKIKRVLTNLLGNAMKFTPEGGKINVNAYISDSQIKVEVVDNGIGISRENLSRVFEKFFQVDSSITRSAGGMGMGLAISKELVELHGGKITAESEGLGKGTKITFTLPINTL